MIQDIIIAYVPIVHKGYIELFSKYPDAMIYILDNSFLGLFPWLRKDLRAMDPENICEMINAVIPSFNHVKTLNLKHLEIIKKPTSLLGNKLFVLPDEDISHELAEKFLFGCNVIFEPIFLRYDKIKTRKEDPVITDCEISYSELDRHFMSLAKAEAQKSEDWWRQVGAVLVKDETVILARHNTHLPTSYSLYIYGDPRGNYSRGLNYEFSTAIHAEAGIISEAANRGISTKGSYLYVKDFPCPPCTRVIALSGIEKLYFHSGYSVLEGKELLKTYDIEIIQVK